MKRVNSQHFLPIKVSRTALPKYQTVLDYGLLQWSNSILFRQALPTFRPHQLTGTLAKGRSAISVTGADILHTRILIFGTLFSLIFRIIQFKPGFLSLVNRCKFTTTPDFSDLPIMLNQFLFSHRVVRKIRRGFTVFI